MRDYNRRKDNYMPETETGKVLNIRGITEETHWMLREYAEMNGLSQAKALKRALQIATSIDEIKSSTS
jgi:hypothetical protein